MTGMNKNGLSAPLQVTSKIDIPIKRNAYKIKREHILKLLPHKNDFYGR